MDCVKAESNADRSTLFVFGAYGIGGSLLRFPSQMCHALKMNFICLCLLLSEFCALALCVAGKERVFMAVAEELNCKVYVDGARWKNMLCFDWSALSLARLTTDSTATNLWVANIGQINFKALGNMREKRGGRLYDRVVGFQPTGWTYTSPTERGRARAAAVPSPPSLVSLRPGSGEQVTIYNVPYSEHSSYSELVDFVKTFRYRSVVILTFLLSSFISFPHAPNSPSHLVQAVPHNPHSRHIQG